MHQYQNSHISISHKLIWVDIRPNHLEKKLSQLFYYRFKNCIYCVKYKSETTIKISVKFGIKLFQTTNITVFTILEPTLYTHTYAESDRWCHSGRQAGSGWSLSSGLFSIYIETACSLGVKRSAAGIMWPVSHDISAPPPIPTPCTHT